MSDDRYKLRMDPELWKAFLMQGSSIRDLENVVFTTDYPAHWKEIFEEFLKEKRRETNELPVTVITGNREEI